jgi:hypothetical protein
VATCLGKEYKNQKTQTYNKKMKRFFLSLLMVAGVTLASAQGSDSALSESQRKPVTTKWSVFFGEAMHTNHFLNNQEYSGETFGLEAAHGRFFRNSKNVSWKLTLSHVRSMHNNMWGGGLHNAAETSYISTQSYEADYAVFYNWIINDRLQLRAGGSFNIYGGFAFGDNNAVNNVVSADIQTQLMAQAQIRYGWDFKKFGLDLFANLSTPFMGLMVVDERYENFIETITKSDFNLKEYGHLKFSSMHNLQGANFEMGIDFALRNLSISLAYEAKSRWWNAYELQNYRKYSLLKLGISVNLFAQPDRKANKRQF